MAAPDVNKQLAALALPQGGIFFASQAADAGVRPNDLARAARDGAVRRLMRGAYIAGTQPVTPHLRVRAAVMAAGRGAAASHATAAALHGMFWCRGELEPIHVTVPRERYPLCGGFERHRSVALTEGDVVDIHGIPTTSVAWTITDRCFRRPEWVVQRAVDEAVAAGHTSLDELRRLIARRGRFRGKTTMRVVLERFDPEVAATRSEIERLCLQIARTGAIPGIVTAYDVVDREGRIRTLDLAVPPVRVGVEVDSDRHHGSVLGRSRDGRRQNALVLQDWLILRFDDRDLVEAPDRVQDELVNACRLRGLDVDGTT